VYDLLLKLRNGCQGTDLLQVGRAEASIVSDMLADGLVLDSNAYYISESRSATFYDFMSDVKMEFQTPVSADLEVTRRCARTCSYCAYRSGPNVVTASELSTEQWFCILDDLAISGVCLVEFTGGDIITRRDVVEILRYADKLGLFILLTSDLTGLPDRFRDMLPQLNNLVGLQTTVDGHASDAHDLLRGQGGFAQMSRSVSILVESGIPVFGGMIVGAHNVRSVNDVLSLCVDMGFSGVQVAALYPSGRAASMIENVPSNDALASASKTYAKRVFDGDLHATVSNFYKFRNIFDSNPHEFNHMKDMVYMAQGAYDSVRISPHGTCYASIKYEDTDLFDAGSIIDASISNLWIDSPALNKIRQYRAAQPDNHFRAVDLRYLSEFEGSAYSLVAQKHGEQILVLQ
jgi:MoaA/NifB/PqqE/SkfB family radical SAM enzyme